MRTLARSRGCVKHAAMDAATPGHDDEQCVITRVIIYLTSEPKRIVGHLISFLQIHDTRLPL
ncbi:hypothetical protein C8R48DRAFT_693558 [Suillus tomentosus]|nr:hypothetical protein C8R48DRAFT_693558 [Suillus tomentosus]